MSRRVYLHEFFDINGDYVKVESEKDLKEIEWEIKENKHNIEVLNGRFVDRMKPSMRDVIKKRG